MTIATAAGHEIIIVLGSYNCIIENKICYYSNSVLILYMIANVNSTVGFMVSYLDSVKYYM